jgi:hypothetical protein
MNYEIFTRNFNVKLLLFYQFVSNYLKFIVAKRESR